MKKNVTVLFEDIGFRQKLLLRMKLTLLGLFICFMQVSASVYSQATKFSFELKQKQVAEVLREIEDNSNFRFFYQREQVDVERVININSRENTVEEILTAMFKEEGVKYKVLDNDLIVLTPSEKNFTEILDDIQQGVVSGKVTDSNGEPLPGVTVLVKGTTQGTITNDSGEYSLTSVPDGAVLRYSFIGMLTQEMEVGNRTTVDIVMSIDAIGIEEVVAVGYGVQKKVNVTAAVTQISAKELGSITTTSIGASLQGQLPGLFVRDAGYNQGLSYLIRGATTIGNNSPLFIVDGIPQNSDNIDPNDIESISVLKDGAASAIYGARAAAGVVLITTKSGEQGKTVFSYETYTGWGDLTTRQEPMNSVNSAKIMNMASINSGGVELFTPEQIAKFESGNDHYYANTNWQDEVLKTERSNKHYLSVSGGNSETSYLFSLGYKKDDGIMNGIERKKYTLRSNIKTKVNEKIEVSANLNYAIIDNTSPTVNGGIDNIFLHMSGTAPFMPVYASEEDGGGYQHFNLAGGYGRGFWNAVWELEAGPSNYEGSEFTANAGIVWDIIGGLKFTGRYSGVFGNANTQSYLYTRDYKGAAPWVSNVTSASRRYDNSRQLNAQNFFSYDKEIEGHSISVLAGWDVQFNKSSFLYGARRNFQFNELLGELDSPNSGDKDDITGLSSNLYESALQSGVGRISYNYQSKYFLEASGRYDGSSKFAPETRYGFFPAVSGKWAISEEDFFSSNFFDYLRLRASYGESGNNAVGGNYYSNISFGTYYFGMGDIVGSTAAEGGIPFRDLRWETTASSNIGLEFSIKERFLSGEIDFYNKITNDILLASPVQGVVGTNRSGPAINAGSVKNSGIELILTHRGNVQDFNYSVSLNGTHNNNEILELTDAFSEWGNTRIGDPLGALYGYISDGIIKSEAEAEAYKSSITSGIHPNTSAGDIKYKDINNDSVLDFKDRVLIGETLPKITYGLRLQANWKNFDFLAFFQGVAAGEQVKRNDLFGNYAWIPEEANDAWSESNPNGSYPRPLLFAQQTYLQNFYTDSDYWVFKAGYLRMKNIQVGYTLPIRANTILNSVRLYATGTNLFTMSNYRPGHDPETGGLGIPPLKTYVIGLNVKF